MRPKIAALVAGARKRNKRREKLPPPGTYDYKWGVFDRRTGRLINRFPTKESASYHRECLERWYAGFSVEVRHVE